MLPKITERVFALGHTKLEYFYLLLIAYKSNFSLTHVTLKKSYFQFSRQVLKIASVQNVV